MKKFHVGEYVRITPHLRKLRPEYWISSGMLEFAGMTARVEKSMYSGVYLDIGAKKNYVWHPTLLERIERITADGDSL